jgi:phage protein D
MRSPVVQIFGQSGADLIPEWSQTLTRVTFRDNDGGEPDELEITFAVEPPFPDSPSEGTKYRLAYGWDGSPMRDGGLFTYQNDNLDGDAEAGYTMTIVARSADFVDVDKTADTEHFEETNVGDLFKKLASSAGKSAQVHPDLAKIKLPYRLRMGQSALGFGQDLADEIGATLKPANGQWLVLPRGRGETASGKQMPTILIPFSTSMPFGLSNESRGKFKDVEASYFDPAEGIRKQKKVTGAGKASRFMSIHPARSAEEAEFAGKADAAELSRNSISGSITIEGDTGAMAGAPVKLFGFGSRRDALDLVAPSIEHEWTFDESGGWLMTVEVAMKGKKD